MVDLGFGDAGKGLVTDALVRAHAVATVVRANGGGQAGHRVVAPDGRAHIFAQVGAGSFVPEVATVLARTALVDPLALAVEADRLDAIRVPDVRARLWVEAGACIVTPWHAAANRARERARGEGRHGSCGVGIGEAAAAAERRPDTVVRAGDLGGASLVERAAHGQRALRDTLEADGVSLGDEAAWFEPALAARWAERARWLADRVVDDAVAVVRRGPVVFEGAQGVLLDRDHGFAPHITRSWTTLREPVAAALRWGLSLRHIGVLRAHAVRHGAGPLPSVDSALRPSHDHNRPNPWQGAVRYGVFDRVLARYAARVVGRLDGLVLTHLDTWDARQTDTYRLDGAPLDDLAVSAVPARGTQAEAGRMLERVTPVFAARPSLAAWIAAVEADVGAPVIARSRAPSGLGFG